MNTAHIERHRRHRRRHRHNRRVWGCGCFAALSFVMTMLCTWLYAFGLLTPVLFKLIGVESLGRTEDWFVEVSPAPTIVLPNRDPELEQITVNLGDLGRETLATGGDMSAQTGNTVDGAPAALVSFTEAGLMDLCIRRSVICRSGNNLYRNVSVDLRPGGAVIYADVHAGLYWERVGVVAQLDDTRTRFYIAGVDVRGALYNPSTLPFDLKDVVEEAIRRIEIEGNNALRDLVVSAGGAQYTLAEVSVDETTLTLTLR